MYVTMLMRDQPSTWKSLIPKTNGRVREEKKVPDKIVYMIGSLLYYLLDAGNVKPSMLDALW